MWAMLCHHEIITLIEICMKQIRLALLRMVLVLSHQIRHNMHWDNAVRCIVIWEVLRSA